MRNNELRSLALEAIRQVLSSTKKIEEVFEEVAGNLAGNDRSRLYDLVAGTIRWHGRIGFLIDRASTKKKPTGRLRRMLEVCAYQLLAQEVSPALVVSEGVAWVRSEEGEPPAKFANAVLRRISESAALPKEEAFSQQRTAQTASLPGWIWERLKKERGEDWAWNFAESSLERPVVFKRERENEKGETLWMVQNISSQRLVEEASKLLQSRGIHRVIDVCASPGGKAIGLAWNGFSVLASDFHEVRLERLRENLVRTQTTDRVEIMEWKKVWEKNLEGPAVGPSVWPSVWPCVWPSVWIDAPCTGTGTLRKNPEIRWQRQEKDLESLKAIQIELLTTAFERLAPGGVLIYSVCSVLAEEGALQIQKLMSTWKNNSELIQEWFLSPQETLGADGFYAAAVLKSRSS